MPADHYHDLTIDTRSRSVATRVLAAFAAVYMFIGFYVEPPLSLGPNLVVPAASVILALPVLLISVAGQFTPGDFRFLAGCAAVFALSAVLSPGLAYIGEKGLGIGQTMTSLIAGVALVKFMDLIPRRTLDRLLATGWGLVLLGAALEAVGPLRPAVRAFGRLVYDAGGYPLYSADVRDLTLTGFPRPVLFTSEPSLVAIGFMMLANSWLLMRPSLRRLAIVLVATLAMLPITGSLVLILSIASSLTLVGATSGRLKRSATAAFVGLALIAGFSLAVPSVAARFRDRLTSAVERATTLQQTSENLRLVFPAITTVDVLSQSPAFGVGLSGKEAIGGLSRLPFDDFVTDVRLGNNLANLFVYLGILGTAAFLWLWTRYARTLGITRIAPLAIITLALSQCMGGFETPRFWGYVFLAVGAMRAASPGSLPSAAALRAST